MLLRSYLIDRFDIHKEDNNSTLKIKHQIIFI